jgi:hypothetical protein
VLALKGLRDDREGVVLRSWISDLVLGSWEARSYEVPSHGGSCEYRVPEEHFPATVRRAQSTYLILLFAICI